MASTPPSALLIEYDDALQLLNQLVLEAAGFTVTLAPLDVDPAATAAHVQPSVIVLHLGEYPPYTPRIVDELQENPTTRAIPVCVIATSDKLAAEAQASPNVPVSVIAPYDLDSLERAVRETLDSPPAAAVLPNPPEAVPRYVADVVDELNQNARAIVLQVVVHRLRPKEPYRSLFAASHSQMIQLVDHLGTILGAILMGLQRDLEPVTVFQNPKLEGYIDEHIQLRLEQGLGVLTAVGEYQLLRDECLAVVERTAGTLGVTALEVVDVARRVTNFTDGLAEIVVRKYWKRRSDLGGDGEKT